MTVSIVFPVYNKSELLPTTLPSLLSQTYRDFELIAVDDGSTDGSGDFLDRLAKTDSRVKVIRQPNAGVSAARNAALDRASGDYVVFADADDTVCPDWLEVLTKEAETSGADIVVSGLNKTNKDGKIIGKTSPEHDETLSAAEIFHGFHTYQGNGGLLGFCVGKLFIRSLCSGIRFTPGLKLAEDLDFFVRLYDKAETVRTVRYAGYNYLQNAVNSAMFCSAYNVNYLSQIEIWLNIRGILRKNGAYNEENRRFVEERLQNYALCALLYNNGTPEVNIRHLKELCGTVQKRKTDMTDAKALIPVSFCYRHNLNALCRAYSYLFRLRLKNSSSKVQPAK